MLVIDCGNTNNHSLMDSVTETESRIWTCNSEQVHRLTDWVNYKGQTFHSISLNLSEWSNYWVEDCEDGGRCLGSSLYCYRCYGRIGGAWLGEDLRWISGPWRCNYNLTAEWATNQQWQIMMSFQAGNSSKLLNSDTLRAIHTAPCSVPK